MLNATNPLDHLPILRLLELSDGATTLDESDGQHLTHCNSCREILQAFTSDRAKHLYRRPDSKAQSA